MFFVYFGLDFFKGAQSFKSWGRIFKLLRTPGIASASLFRLAGRYDYPIPAWFLDPLDCSKIPALSFELYRQKLLTGKWQENSQIFNEDFYLPLYLSLWVNTIKPNLLKLKICFMVCRKTLCFF